MNKFEKWFKRFKILVEDDMARFLQTHSTRGYFPIVDAIYNDLCELVFRAGRTGSALALATYEGVCGHPVNANVVRIGTALELYGYSILIHDDIYDNDDVRCGKTAFHTMYVNRAKELGLPSSEQKRFGCCLAIIAGNILQSLAVNAITTSTLQHELVVQLVDNLNKSFRTVNESQVIDIQFEGTWPTSKDWYKMASRRAAAHTYHCLSAGGILAEWSAEKRKPLEEASLQLGYAFDIRDDLLDTFSSYGTGLQPGQRDLQMHKKPLHVCLALEHCPDKDKVALMQNLKKPNAATNGKLISLLFRYGFHSTVLRFKQHIEQARILFEHSCLSAEAKEFFYGLLARNTHVIETLIEAKS